jgi:hypothetical protein
MDFKTKSFDNGSFKKNWLRFSKWVSSRDASFGKSSMWQSLIKDFDLYRNGEFPADMKNFVFGVNRFRNYGFILKGDKEQKAGFFSTFSYVQFLIVRILNVLRGRVWSINLSNGVVYDQNAQAAARQLAIRGLLDGYLDFCYRNNFQPYTFNPMKCYYLATELNKELGSSEKVNILEIGGGTGNLASNLIDIANVNQYFIVDLPEMLLTSSMAISALYPDLPVHFIYPEAKEKYDSQKSGVYFCVPEMIDTIISDSFELAFNIDSFQEMTESQIHTYLKLIQRAVKQGGVFVNLNRRKYLSSEQFDNNPLMYPYAALNNIRRWEVDSFMLNTLNIGGVRPDSWLYRSEVINKK